MTKHLTDNDWRGEAFIRSVPRPIKVNPKIEVCKHEGCSMALREHNKDGLCHKHRPKKVCDYEGCDRILDPRNTTGRCVNHINRGRK